MIKAIPRAALGLVGLALATTVAVLGVWTYTLYHDVAFLRAKTIPHDVKQVMTRKQYYADKTWHAGQARDWQAAGWYAAQIWRMGNEIAKAGLVNSNGPLAELEQTMFLPTIDPLIDAMRADDVEAFEARYRDMVAACNACHAATDHAYVRIAVPGEGAGRWNQTFEPSGIDW